MIISIDECSIEPLYKQIHDQIIVGIATGELEPGTSLPSVRSLASDLGINLHTVNKAYAVLRDEGYVQMRGRAGAVISEPGDAFRADKNRESLEKMEDDLFKLALTYRACGGSRGHFLESAAAQAARAYGVIGVEEDEAVKTRSKAHSKGRSKENSTRTSRAIEHALDGLVAHTASTSSTSSASAQGV